MEYEYDALEEECDIDELDEEYTYVDEADLAAETLEFDVSAVLAWEIDNADAPLYDYYRYLTTDDDYIYIIYGQGNIDPSFTVSYTHLTLPTICSV